MVTAWNVCRGVRLNLVKEFVMLRIFLKQHRSYIIVYVLNFILISYLVFVTGAAIDDRLISYAGLLSFVLLVLFLVWRFWQMRPLYEELSKSVMQLEDMKVNLPKKDAVTVQFVQYMDQQYKVGREALLEAEANNERWRLLIINWVHHMRSPINGLRLALENQREGAYYELLLECDRLDQQLDTILNLARVSSIASDLVIEELDLNDVLKTAINNHKRQFIYKQITPAFKSITDAYVYSDRKWITFIIEQLLRNALKFSRMNSVMTCTVTRTDGAISLIITDQGVGIPASDLPRVFELYFTGYNGRHNKSSTGIGLYLVKQVATELNIKVCIESEEQVGTQITLTFPQ